ncbi:hypothetical protein B7H23_13295 [Notoacmeibacter marinus]|uniref:Uncharacterized protein n=1 Tax=Notoacmeibacter marinus TaxID=1876515 RepID=A0A231UT95_9HYPH|nr:hypothetical protein [Notoacmeibacter marinus]OXS99168.1 hypothetical protein B7H23_13295 [Notoacmeibacter marinus]
MMNDRAENDNSLRDRLKRFETAVIFANSTAADPAGYEAKPDTKRLHVFFGPVWKILGEPFTQNSLLCQPMRTHETLIQSAGNREAAQALFASGALIGTAAVRGGKDHFGPLDGRPATIRPDGIDFVIDGRATVHGWYTQGRPPSTGFMVALWLMENCPWMTVTLDGFTGVPDGANKMLNSHDWILEQSVLEIERRAGRLTRLPEPGTTTVQALQSRYPDMDVSKIAEVVQGNLEITVAATRSLAAKAVRRRDSGAVLRKWGARLRSLAKRSDGTG